MCPQIISKTLEILEPMLQSEPKYNSCLLNIFANGKDITPEHTDIHQLTKMPDSVALLAIGAARKFQFRNNDSFQLLTPENRL